MTLSSTLSRITYAGDGSTDSFAVPFAFFGADEIAVIERNQVNGAESEKLLTTDYLVAGGNGQAGTVTATVPPLAGKSWTILRNTQRTQMVDYTPNDPFPAETHERALDRLTALVQELDDKLDRSATLSPTSSMSSLLLPEPAGDRLIGWKNDLSGLENKHLPEGSAVYASIAATLGGGALGEAVTPRGLAALWRKGADIASAATLVAPLEGDRGGYHRVTGSNDIAALWAEAPMGDTVELHFADGLMLQHDPVSLVLPGGTDVDVQPGDVARFRAEGDGLWRCVAAPPAWHVSETANLLSLPVSAKVSDHVMLADDLGREICFGSAGVTLAMLPATVADNGGVVAIRNAAAGGDVTLNPDGSETLDGFTTRKLRPGDCVLLRSDGSAWRSIAGDYSYDSGELTITSGGALTLAHGLGQKPYLLRPFLRCKTAENGWAVGEEIDITFAGSGTGFSTHRWPGFRSDDTNIVLRFGSGTSAFGYVHAATGSEANLTNSHWRMIVRAKAR
jgi:hypothetical protein